MVRQCSDIQTEGLRAELKAFLAARPDLSTADMAQHSTLAESTWRSFSAAVIPGGREVIGEVRRVLELAKAGEVLRLGGNGAVVLAEDHTERVRRVPKSRNFYSTQMVRRVAEVLNFCVENSAIGVITAPFGCGKTESVTAWRRANAGKVESLLFEFSEFTSTNKVDFVRVLGHILGIDTAVGSQNGGLVFREICERLRKTPMLLIFDQCETVRPRVLQIIRQIWDRTHDAGVGVVLLSAPILLVRIDKSRMADLGALTSRVGIWAPLAGISKSEMAAIVKQEGITDIEDSAFDLWWKATGGSMRRLMRAVDLLKSKHQGKRITEKTIAGVAGHLWGMAISTE
jgi:DNA transposition AAA+ family ATPase